MPDTAECEHVCLGFFVWDLGRLFSEAQERGLHTVSILFQGLWSVKCCRSAHKQPHASKQTGALLMGFG